MDDLIIDIMVGGSDAAFSSAVQPLLTLPHSCRRIQVNVRASVPEAIYVTWTVLASHAANIIFNMHGQELYVLGAGPGYAGNLHLPRQLPRQLQVWGAAQLHGLPESTALEFFLFQNVAAHAAGWTGSYADGDPVL